MFTIDNIKKIFNNFEIKGFCFVPGIGLCYKGDDLITDAHKELFLQRVLQAINKDSELYYFINIDRFDIGVLDSFRELLKEYPDTDEGLESAIIYVLDNIKGE